MAKLTKIQKEIIEQKFYNISTEINKMLNIPWEEKHIIDRLFPAFIKFCRQDPDIILDVLETFEPNKRIIYDNSFLIIKSSIGYPFKKINSMGSDFIDKIEKCRQSFIEELAFAKSFSISNIQKIFNNWKQDHVMPKVNRLKSIQTCLLIDFVNESAPNVFKNFEKRIMNINVNIVPLTINKES